MIQGTAECGYETITGQIRKSNFAVDLNGGDVILIEIVAGSDPADASQALFNAALDDIHFTDELSELDQTDRVFCPDADNYDEPIDYGPQDPDGV